MLGTDGDRETAEVSQKAAGKKITKLELASDKLIFTFADGSMIKLWDDGQSCCEKRYMHTDDDLPYYIGSRLLDIEIRDAPDVPDEYDYHEVQFLLVTTSKGVFTMVTHNEHNGWYGGFSIRCQDEAQRERK